ncbi:hypothetical protein [Haladaptatus sp. DYSN1]|uniref:hypothetical protein n=1 Tax=unclassified Haladaptatus TaxID=2622732 RepID=UPI0024076E0A|nr:hypothetical protein [Haladaptatus sp. DYSN1]
MRGPLHALWNTRLIGTYLKFRVGIVLAVLLAMGAGVVALGIGGIAGTVALFGLVALAFLTLWFAVLTR